MFLYQYIILIFLVFVLPLKADANNHSINYSKNNITLIKVKKNKATHNVTLNHKTITKAQIVTKNGKKITVIKITPTNNPNHKVKKAKHKIKRAYKKHHNSKPHAQGSHNKPNNKKPNKHHKKQTTIIIIKPSNNKPINPNPPNNDVQPIKVVPPKVFVIPPKIKPSNNIPINYQPNKKGIKEKYEDYKNQNTGFIYDVNGSWGENSYSNNYSLSTTIAYKFSKNYYSGLSFYNYVYQEDYNKSAGKNSINIEPASNEVLANNSLVLAWYNGYKVSQHTILFSQLGIPFGDNHNRYSNNISGYNHYNDWVEGNVTGEESFKGVFTMDLGVKYYLASGFYVGSQYRLFVANINTNEYIIPNVGSAYSRNLKAGRYNISSVLVSLGYTFNAK